MMREPSPGAASLHHLVSHVPGVGQADGARCTARLIAINVQRSKLANVTDGQGQSRPGTDTQATARGITRTMAPGRSSAGQSVRG